MRIRKVAEPFKHIAGNTLKCISIGEAIAECQTPTKVVSLDERRQRKLMEVKTLANVNHRR